MGTSCVLDLRPISKVGGARKPVSVKCAEQAVRLYLGGYSSTESARISGISPAMVLRLVKRTGASTRPFKPHNKKAANIVAEAVRLYTVEEKTMPEVASLLGVSLTAVGRWLRSSRLSRGYSAAFALAIRQGRKQPPTGRDLPYLSTKTGRLSFADSKWEAVRMFQLDADESVSFWDKSPESVPYEDESGKRRLYTPDFYVEYMDGRKEVQEVKPSTKLADERVCLKAKAATKYFCKKGIVYRFVTEKEIGWTAIERFTGSGLIAVTLAQRREHRRLHRNARLKRQRMEAKYASA